MVHAMSNEDKFWADAVGRANPGWTIQSADTSMRSPISKLKNYLYVFDTHTGWHCAGALSDADVDNCAGVGRGLGKERLDALWETSSSEIVSLADQAQLGDPTKPSHHEQSRALSIVMATLTQSRTYQVAKRQFQTGSLHWLYIVYRLKDGALIGRPGVIGRRGGPSDAGGMFMEPDRLNAVLHMNVASDTDKLSQTSVAQMIRASGGAILWDGLREAIGRRRPDVPRG